MRSLIRVACSLAAVLIVAVACTPKTPPAQPAPAAQPSAPAPPAAAPRAAPPAATPATPTPSASPTTSAPATPPAAESAATPPAAGSAETGGRGGRGGRGNPPPPPPPIPAVMPAPVTPIVSMTAPSPDPRVGLSAGHWDAGQAAWNLKLVSTTPPTEKFVGVTNSDLAFSGKYVIQGNYNGFQVFDVSNPVKPVMVMGYVCPASQSDVSVYKNLLFVSGEGLTGRVDCGIQGVPDPVSKDRLRGIRIFDISDIAHPKNVANVQTCRGSHTHTVVTDPNDKENIYIYVSGSSQVRSADELPGCVNAGIEDPNTALFRLEVIKVPLAAPEKAAITSSPRIFQNLAPPPRNPERDAAGARGAGPGGAAAGGAPGAPDAPGAAAGGVAAGGAAPGAGRGGGGGRGAPSQCHDITVYPDVGLAGGACGGYGLLLDIREAAYPIRIDAAADANMAFWHSATFSNDGKRILFSDEWGGGTQPRCRDTDKLEWGADSLFAIENNKMVFKSYYKMPAAQTSFENCVAHNGSMIPIPGREVMAQGWYQGGISVFDWTDLSHPKEIAYFDRGPINNTRLITGGSWSVYWYNGLLYSSEIARGLDIFELLPSGLVTENEIDAAKTVQIDYLNAQQQRKFVWPPSFALARAYMDQLERSKGLTATRIAAVRTALGRAEQASGAQRSAVLTGLGAGLNTDAARSTDREKVRLLSQTVTALAKAR